jgi:hypothetical protein
MQRSAPQLLHAAGEKTPYGILAGEAKRALVMQAGFVHSAAEKCGGNLASDGPFAETHEQLGGLTINDVAGLTPRYSS